MDDDEQLDPETRRLLDDAWDALDDGDLRAAARGLAAARAAAADDPAVFELEAELALAREEPEAALAAYRRWNAAAPDDPEPWLSSAEVHLDYGEPGDAARLLRELLAEFDLDPLDEAEARQLLGLACDEKGDRKGMVKEWLAVLRLDAANEDPKPLMSAKRFQKVAAAAIDELPEEILAHLQNVPIFVEDRPSEALVLEGLDPRTLGLFHGIAMPDQSVLGAGPEPGLIHLFQRNLERVANDEDDLAEQIRITVLHETAHYFGADEDDMHRFGLN
ncbi:MAG: metallopeptidase family protein [Actinomycetes bacterium]